MKTLPVGLLILVSSLFFLQAKAQPDTTKKGNRFLVFSRTEVEASFPGGNKAWKKYISSVFEQHKDSLSKKDNGTCIVRFIVHSSGEVSQVKAITKENTRLAKIAVEAIAKGPKWIPPQHNNKFVSAYKQQAVTFRFGR